MNAKPGADSPEYTAMHSSHRTVCEHCGAPLDPHRSGGVCAACALGDALMDAPEELGELGGYQLLEEIARGGMGVVYRARQYEPEREVALKALLGAGLSSAATHERFRIEARVMAELEHPGILPIFAVGEQDGIPFFTMKLATGGSLATRRPALSGKWRSIAELIAGVADAVQFAHLHGVLHRDLKPGNILFDESGRAYVSDFGLAKLLATDSHLTRSEAMMGTPTYLAPEAAMKDARAATIASDVWGLGAMLFELLAQRPPFVAESVPGLLRKVVEEDPEPMASISAVPPPRDLEVIALKALAKDPAQRYASASALGDDLRRWLAGEPIHARPSTVLERFTVWAQRNPGLAASLGLLFLTLVAFAASQNASKRRLEAALAETQLREIKLRRASDQAGQRFETLAGLKRLAQVLPESSRAALRSEAAAALALPDLRVSSRWAVPIVSVTGTEAFSSDLSKYAVVHARDSIGVFDSSTQTLIREWSHPDAHDVQELSFSLDTRWVAARFGDRHWELLPMDPAKEKIRTGSSIAFQPDCQSYATVRPGDGLYVVSLADGSERLVVRQPLHEDPIMVDPTGEYVFAVSGDPPRGSIFRLSDGGQQVSLGPVPHRITAMDCSRDGRWIALADGNPPYSVQIIDVREGQQSVSFADHQKMVRKLQFHPDSHSFVAVSDGQKLIWRSIETRGFRLDLEAGERAVNFSRDGTRLGYSPNDGQLGVLEVAQPTVFQAWPEPGPDGTSVAYTAALSANDRWAAAATDRGIHLWDAKAHREVAVHPHQTRRPWWSAVCFDPRDAARIIWSPLGEGVWEAKIDAEGRLIDPHPVAPTKDGMLQELGPDGRSLVVIEAVNEVNIAKIWPDGNAGQGRVIARDFPFVGFRILRGVNLGFSTHFNQPDVTLWNLETARRIRGLGIKEPAASEPSPDGRWLLTGTRSENVVWDVSTWQVISRWPSRPGERDAWAVAFSPDARVLAKAMPTGEVSLRRVPSGEEIATLIPPSSSGWQQIIFTSDGRKLLLLQATGRFHEWDLARLKAELRSMGLGWD